MVICHLNKAEGSISGGPKVSGHPVVGVQRYGILKSVGIGRYLEISVGISNHTEFPVYRLYISVGISN